MAAMNVKVFALILAVLSAGCVFASWYRGADHLTQIFWMLDADIWIAAWCVMHHLDRKAAKD